MSTPISEAFEILHRADADRYSKLEEEKDRSYIYDQHGNIQVEWSIKRPIATKDILRQEIATLSSLSRIMFNYKEELHKAFLKLKTLFPEVYHTYDQDWEYDIAYIYDTAGARVMDSDDSVSEAGFIYRAFREYLNKEQATKPKTEMREAFEILRAIDQYKFAEYVKDSAGEIILDSSGCVSLDSNRTYVDGVDGYLKAGINMIRGDWFLQGAAMVRRKINAALGITIDGDKVSQNYHQEP